MSKHSPTFLGESEALLCSCGQRFAGRDGYLAHWDRMASVEAANVLIVVLFALLGMGLAFYVAIGLDFPGWVLPVGGVLGLIVGVLFARRHDDADAADLAEAESRS